MAEAQLKLLVKHGGASEFPASLPASATVAQLKQQLEQATGVFVRQQKLIYKGKVLADAASLADCKLADGAKVMLLSSQQGAPAKPAPRAAAAAAATARSTGSGSSLLAQKMADMAAARTAGAGSASAKAAAGSMMERKAGWSKSGIISLRDMQLNDLSAAWLEGMTGARAADFSHNTIPAIPAAHPLWQLRSLASLKLTHNSLQDAGLPWPQLVAGLGSLTSLMLGFNQLQQLPASLSQLTGLAQLDLQHNHLCNVEHSAFEGLAKLEALQLQGNQLQQLPDSLGCCSSLVALNASHNRLQSLPDSLCRLQKLQVLAVDCNKIASLPAQLLADCSSLSTLSAHSNPITVADLRAAAGYEAYEARRRARASKQIGGRVMADLGKAFSEGADVEQWERWSAGTTGLGSDGSGRAGQK